MISLKDIAYLFKRKSHSWVHPFTAVKNSNIDGLGRFALQPIEAGSIVAIVGGFIVDLRKEKLISGLQISEHFAIRGSFSHKSNNLINHSCDPNCAIAGEVTIVALRNIAAGEEITVDYGGFLFSNEQITYIKVCKCNHAKCRQKITSSDWKTLGPEKLNFFLKRMQKCKLSN